MNRLEIITKLVLFLVLVTFTFACATAYDKRGVYHKVRGGENIQKIARYYHVPVQDLAEWNNIQDQKQIQAGLKLYIPKTRRAGPLKHKKIPRSERAKFDAPIQFDRTRFSWPVAGKLLSPFGIRNGRRHDGLDIKAKRETPIRAAAAGKVVFNGRLKGYGNMLILRHKDRFFTVYAHNSKNAVRKGGKVAKGQTIGYVGSTGRSTGPHLHFEVRKGQKARNPLFFLPAAGSESVMIAKEERQKAGKTKRPKVEETAAKREVKRETKGKWSRRKQMMEELKTKRAR